MEALTLEDALDFYRTYYAPNNAILVVAGDVDLDEVRALAEIHYGPLAPSADLPERARPMEPPQRAARRLIYEDPRVRQEVVIRDYLVPVRRDGQETAAALAALAGVLGDGLNSVLTRELVVEQGLAIQAGAFYSGSARDYGRLSVYAVPRPEIPLEAMETALDAALAGFLAGDGPEEAVLDRFKTQWRAAWIYAQDSQQSLARRYGAGLAADLTIDQIEAWPDVLQAVSVDDVLEAGRAHLRPERSVTGWLRAPQEVEG
jgi:zinc protease